MSNTTTRILVGLVGIPLVIALILWGGWFFFAFAQLIALLALKEFYDMARRKSAQPLAALGYVWTLIAGAYVFYENLLPSEAKTFTFGALWTVFVLTTLGAELWRNKPSPMSNVGATVLGAAYVASCMESLLDLRVLFFERTFAERAAAQAGVVEAPVDAWGAALVMCLFAGIWICDSAAFFAGKTFGKHKLFPRVSPKKSWEGAVAGFVAAAAGFAGLAHYFLPFLPLVHAAVIGALIGIVGQIGDLAESLFKRDADVKDSSSIIPGHGGVFDRFDSALFAAPVTAIYVKILLSVG